MDRLEDLIPIVQEMLEARDEALWKVLHFKCQRCGEIKPIRQAVGLELLPDNGGPKHEIWCENCFKELPHTDL